MASHDSYPLLSAEERVKGPPTGNVVEPPEVTDDNNNDSDNDDNMAQTRPPLLRPTDGRSQQPLLQDEHHGRLSTSSAVEEHHRRLSNSSAVAGSTEERPMLSSEHLQRRRTFGRSRSPEYRAEHLTRRKYMIAAGFLMLSLVSFVVQTETAAYIQHDLGWAKPYCML